MSEGAHFWFSPSGWWWAMGDTRHGPFKRYLEAVEDFENGGQGSESDVEEAQPSNAAARTVLACKICDRRFDQEGDGNCRVCGGELREVAS